MRESQRTLVGMVVAVVVALLSLVSFCSSMVRVRPKEQTAVVEQAQDAPAQEAAEATQAEEPPAEGEGEPEGEGEQSEELEREAFVTAWAERIDSFNAGYPLEGYGSTFAEAAYDNGVDPRYSPAIARVESGSGNHCTYSHNAWGWGSYSWSDWDTAIRAHVSGLASSYGYTLSWNAAERYAPEESDEWYEKVESCMYQIWEDDSL